jgi:hypothetical protein
MYLYGLSNVTHVWRHALDNLVAWHPVKPRLGRPASSYRSNELEATVKRLARLETNWTSSSPKPVSNRNLFVGDRDVWFVPGGRWLLTWDSELPSDITYRDLDLSEPVERVLIPASLVRAGELGALLRLALSMNNSEPFLSFNLVTPSASRNGALHIFSSCYLLIWTFSVSGPRIPIRMQFWRVELDPSFNGLVATPLVSFVTPGSSTSNITLERDLLAQPGYSEDGAHLIRIFRWEECNASVHKRAEIHLGSRRPVSAYVLRKSVD